MDKAIHLHSTKAVTRQNTLRAHRLNESPMLPIDGSPGGVIRAVEYLDVERSARYAPTPTSTFCNIYAYDVACLLGRYIPRVFWSASAWKKILAGENVAAKYAETLFEQNANALYKWFAETSVHFGWKELHTMGEAQASANAGKLTILVAARKNKAQSGHITVVAPEHGVHKATRISERAVIPLQSQAGRINRKFFASQWWNVNYEPIKIYTC